MSEITRKLLLLLAMAVVVSPLRAAWHGHSVRTAHDGHVHFHDHGGTTEAHAHYHHHGETHDQHHDPHHDPHHGPHDDQHHDEGSDHHDGVLDHGETGPMVFWTAPVATYVDPPPVMPRATPLAGASAYVVMPHLRGRPPPRSRGHHQHLDLVAITVLRL